MFAIYTGIELQEIYRMPPATLEPIFAKWEAKWHALGGRDINNPKIPVTFVRSNGSLLYSAPLIAAPDDKTASAGGIIIPPGESE